MVRAWVVIGLLALMGLVAAAASSVHPAGRPCSGALGGGWALAVEKVTLFDNGAALRCVYNRDAALGDGAINCAAPLFDPAGNTWSITSMGLDANGRAVCQYTYPAAGAGMSGLPASFRAH